MTHSDRHPDTDLSNHTSVLARDELHPQTAETARDTRITRVPLECADCKQCPIRCHLGTFGARSPLQWWTALVAGNGLKVKVKVLLTCVRTYFKIKLVSNHLALPFLFVLDRVSKSSQK